MSDPPPAPAPMPEPVPPVLVRGQPPSREELRDSVFRKLSESLLRRLAGRDAVRSTWDVRGYVIHVWTHEALLALAAAGVSHPFLAGGAVGGASEASVGTVAGLVRRFLGSYPTWLALVLVLIVGLWLGLRIWVGVRKLADRGPQILACARELGALESDLEAVLAREKPMKPLIDLVSKSKEIVDRYYLADLWPWPIGPDGQAPWVTARAKQLCDDYQGNWQP